MNIILDNSLPKNQKYKNLLPDTFAEKESINAIFKELKKYKLNYNFIAGQSGKTNIPDNRPIVYFSTSDEYHQSESREVLDKCELIFKNYAPIKQNPKIIPFPLNSNIKISKNLKPISQRSIDYSFIGQINCGIRSYIKDILQGYSLHHSNCYLQFNNSFGYNNNSKKYSEILENSKVCIVMPGGTSVETFRYTEAASAGCIIVCSRMPPFWYYKNPYEFQIPDWGLLPQLLDRLFQIPDNELDAVGTTTLQYYQNFLSPKALAFHCNNFIKQSKLPII